MEENTCSAANFAQPIVSYAFAPPMRFCILEKLAKLVKWMRPVQALLQTDSPA